MTSKQSHWLEKAFTTNTQQELVEVYDNWAEEYDESMYDSGYISPAIVAGLVSRFLPLKNEPILDAGVGTGILGTLLSILGYSHLVGIDMSSGMLNIANRKNVYQELKKMTLGEQLAFADNTFSSIVSMGTFGTGHAPPNSFDELLRITKPEGFIIFTMRTKYEKTATNYEKTFGSLEASNKWKLIETTKTFQHLPLTTLEWLNKAFVYKVL